MRINIPTLTLAFVATSLTGCAGLPSTLGECHGNSICPIVIYEKSPGVFAALPDQMKVFPDRPNHATLLWTFAEPSKYKFMTKTQNAVDDGVQLVDNNGVAHGLRACFITNDSRLDAGYAVEGRFLRCDVKSSAKFDPVGYKVRFHAMDNSVRVLDPTMSSSGGSDHGLRADPPRYLTVLVDVGKPVTLQPLDRIDGLMVVLDAGTGRTFNDDETPVVVKDVSGGDAASCRVTTDPGGSIFPDPVTGDGTGQYVMCLVTSAANPLSLTYSATFMKDGLRTTVNSTMTRP